jgi:ABC-2 type transport system permease protein
MGMLVSILTKSQLLASQVAILATFLPAFLLSGFMFSIADMPRVIQMLTYLVPARYLVLILKAIYLKGVGLEVLAVPAAFLLIYSAVMAILAIVMFKKKLS